MIHDYSQPELFSTNRKPKFPVDVCESRHRQNPASVAANPSEEYKRESHRQILAFIGFMGQATSKEVARALDKPLNAISGRLSELKASGQIEQTGEREESCAVLRIRR